MEAADLIASMLGGDTIRSHIYGLRASTTGAFDERNRDLIGAVEQDLANIYRVLFWTVVYGGTMSIGRSMAALALFNRASETLVSAFHLARQRATAESMALMRIAIEAGCSAVWILEQARAWEEFSSERIGKFKATAAIRYAKKYIPRVHELYVRLSQVYLHPNRLAFGSLITDEGAAVKIGSRDASQEEDNVVLIALSLASGMVLKAMEVTLLEPVPEDSSLLRVPGSRKRVRAVADQLIENRYATIGDLWEMAHGST